jgi:hypothetical protein
MKGLIGAVAALCAAGTLAQIPAHGQLSHRIKDINMSATGANSLPSFGAELNGITIFNATDVNGAEVWRTDGTPQGNAMTFLRRA